MRRPGLLACVLAGAACAACGGDGARLRLAPTNAGPCGHPDDARTILVTPLGDFLAGRRAIEVGGAVELADLPAATRSLAIEILGAGGEVRAIGRTAPLVLDALADGDVIPIAMAPPDGMCPAGALLAPRDGARIARVGDGVLVVGGGDASAELYDPATETSVAVPLPVGFTVPGALVGAALTALPDGRAVLIGGPRPGLAIYQPGAGFTMATLLTEVRAHHVALALDDRHVLVAGGCGVVSEAGACEAGNARLDARVLDLDSTEFLEPRIPLTVARLDGTGALELGPDGTRAVLLTGGVDAAGLAVADGERISLDGGAAVVLPGTGAALARLDSGATLTAFGPASAPGAAAAVVVPGGATPRATSTIAARAGGVLVTQDDGMVIGLGGGPPIRYRPSQHDWQLVDGDELPIAGAPAALRWDDGSVLVFGGRDGGGPSAGVVRFRPRLLGPFTGSLAVVPRDGGSDPPLTPLDPAAVDRADGWKLGGPAPSWAIVGGPTGGPLHVDLVVDVPAAGLGLLTGFVDPAQHDRITLVPGQAARLERIRAGAVASQCTGSAVPAAGRVAVAVDNGAATLRVTVGGVAVLACPQVEHARGAIGVAALGAQVAIESIAIGR